MIHAPMESAGSANPADETLVSRIDGLPLVRVHRLHAQLDV